MKLVNFTAAHIEAAQELVRADYDQERSRVPSLPAITAFALPSLVNFADNQLGVAAFEGNKMVGFLCSGAPYHNAFRSTDVTGVFSPLGASGADLNNRAKVYAAMYQAAGDKWARAGAASHGICLYAHDTEVQQQLFRYGFGMRCVDAIRCLQPLEASLNSKYSYLELTAREFQEVWPLDQELNEHMQQSPIFMLRPADSQAEFLTICQAEQARCFIAVQQEQICAYLKVVNLGETFITPRDDTKHINGAFCLPQHRSNGMFTSLLNFTMGQLAAEGFTRLGVDFESFNPSACGFWLKHFTAYTYSVVRRIDERIINKIRSS